MTASPPQQHFQRDLEGIGPHSTKPSSNDSHDALSILKGLILKRPATGSKSKENAVGLAAWPSRPGN